MSTYKLSLYMGLQYATLHIAAESLPEAIDIAVKQYGAVSASLATY